MEKDKLIRRLKKVPTRTSKTLDGNNVILFITKTIKLLQLYYSYTEDYTMVYIVRLSCLYYGSFVHIRYVNHVEISDEVIIENMHVHQYKHIMQNHNSLAHAHLHHVAAWPTMVLP